MRVKSENNYPSEDQLRAQYGTVVDVAVMDFKRDPSYAIAIAKAAGAAKKSHV